MFGGILCFELPLHVGAMSSPETALSTANPVAAGGADERGLTSVPLLGSSAEIPDQG